MQQITEYQIVVGFTIAELEREVSAAMLYGDWQPLGGPFMTETTAGKCGAQAMVKYEAPPAIYRMSMGTATADQAAAYNEDVRSVNPIRHMGAILPNPAPAPITPMPSTAPGWPAPGVYRDPAGGE